MSLPRAAKQWGISESTLRDRNNEKYELAGQEKIPYLTVAEEDRLADWLVERSKRGFCLSVSEFLDSVQKFIEKDKRETPFQRIRPGRKWYRGFIERDPKVRLRNARPLDKKRAKISAADLDIWFNEYAQFLTEHGLVNRPAQIWNCDETGFDLRGKAGQVFGPSEPRNQPYRVVTGTREHITVLPCFNAAGQWIPPYFLFSGKRVPNTRNPLDGGIYPVCRDQITDDQVRSSLVYSSSDQSTRTPLCQALEASLPEQSVFTGTSGTPLATSIGNITVSVLSSRGKRTSLAATCTPLSQDWEPSLPHQNVLANTTGNVCHQSDQPKQSAYSDAFDALESVLETPVKVKHKRRLDKGYDLDGTAHCRVNCSVLTKWIRNTVTVKLYFWPLAKCDFGVVLFSFPSTWGNDYLSYRARK